MIFAFSTSSPWSSVAILAESGAVLWEGSRHAPQGASAALMAMLADVEATGQFNLSGATGFAADIGPGSFTGVRVAVVMAKTFGFLYGKPVFGADCFDLIDHLGTVVVPSKRGEFFVRRVGEAPFRTKDLPNEPYRGFGEGVEPATPPLAARFGPLLADLAPQDPMVFAPRYLIEPSISIPKRPYADAN